MAYAPADRAFYDADSHIMELPDFLKAYADPKLRDEIPEVSYSASVVTDEEVAQIMQQGGKHSAEHVAAQIAMGDALIQDSKEIQALGAFNSADRTVAMDLLGFKKQLVFATHSVALPFHPSSKKSVQLRYGATRAHNRHMAEFCSQDDRLMGVGVVPLDDPSSAITELEWAIDNGLESIWIPHRAPIGHSPGHVDLEGFWARLAEAGVPFVLHVGGAPLQVARDWGNNGRGAVKDWLGGGENVRTKDAAVLHQTPEMFISMLLLDGVFDRHPPCAARRLNSVPAGCQKCAGAWTGYVGYMVVDTSVRFERPPSEQLKEQMGFTPFSHEHVGDLVADSAADLYLFSSDYPHLEGTKDPIGRFERSLVDVEESVKEAFYSENFLRLWPEARVS